MNNYIKIIYDIIGNEKAITKLIISYFHVETIEDTEFKTIDITQIVEMKHNMSFEWINHEYFYSRVTDSYIHNIYCIKNYTIKKVYCDINTKNFNITKLCNYIIVDKEQQCEVDDKIIVAGYNVGDSDGDNNNSGFITKYNYSKQIIDFTIKLKLDDKCYVNFIAKVLDEIIIADFLTIYKYDYYNSKQIASKSIKCGFIVIANNNIICVNNKMHIIDIKTLETKSIIDFSFL